MVRNGARDTQGKAGRAGLVQAGEGKVWRDLMALCCSLTGGGREDGARSPEVHGERKRGNGNKLGRGKLLLDTWEQDHHKGRQILRESPERLWDLHQTPTGQGLEQLGSDLVQQSWPCLGQRVSPFLFKLFSISLRTCFNNALTLFPGTLSPSHKVSVLLHVALQLLYVNRPSFPWRNQGFPSFCHINSHPQRDISRAWVSLPALPRASP